VQKHDNHCRLCPAFSDNPSTFPPALGEESPSILQDAKLRIVEGTFRKDSALRLTASRIWVAISESCPM
jgi:hypothetical protein